MGTSDARTAPSTDEDVIRDIMARANMEDVPRRFRKPSISGESAEVRKAKALSHVVGLGPLARVTTSFGEVYAQTLRERDLVRTKEGKFLPIVAINRIVLGEGFLRYHPEAQPVVIRAGAFGSGLPVADLVLAPNQQFSKGQRFMGEPISRAIEAAGKPHVYRKVENMITYTVFHCERPATVCVEGIWIDTAP